MKSSEFFHPEPLLIQIGYYFANVGVDANGSVCDLIGAIALAEVHADIRGVLILCRQLPERIFYDNRRVAADSQFKIDNIFVLVLVNERVAPLSRLVTAQPPCASPRPRQICRRF